MSLRLTSCSAGLQWTGMSPNREISNGLRGLVRATCLHASCPQYCRAYRSICIDYLEEGYQGITNATRAMTSVICHLLISFSYSRVRHYRPGSWLNMRAHEWRKLRYMTLSVNVTRVTRIERNQKRLTSWWTISSVQARAKRLRPRQPS